MSIVPRSDFLIEMRNYADSLNIDCFRALSPGIGLGSLQKVHRPEQKSAPLIQQTESPHRIPSLTSGNEINQVVDEEKMGVGSRILARSVALATDAFLVCLSCAIAVGVGFLTLYAIEGHGARSETMAMWQTWLGDAHVLQFIAGIYGIFLVYWLLFKLISGRTPGQTLAQIFHAKSDAINPGRVP